MAAQIRYLILEVLCLTFEVLLFPIAIVNFSICFVGALAVLGLSFDSPLLLQLIALGLGIVAWVMNFATLTVSTERPIWFRLLWLAGMLFSIMAVFFYCFSNAVGEDGISLEIVRNPALLAERPIKDLMIATIFAVVIAASPMVLVWLDIRRLEIRRKARTRGTPSD